MAAPRNPFGGVLGGRPRITGETPFGGGRGPGFSRQNRLDIERAIRDAQQVLRNQRAVTARRKLTERGKGVPSRPQPSRSGRPIRADDPSDRLIKERTLPLQRERAAQAKAPAPVTAPSPKTFAPLRLEPDQVEQTVAKFARPVTAQDVRRGGFQAVTPESAPAQELEARLAQVSIREQVMDAKLGEPVGFNRTVFAFENPPEGGGSLKLTITEIPANNPAGKMVLVSSQRPGADPQVFMVDSRLSALRVIDQVREAATKRPLPRLFNAKEAVSAQFRVPRQVFPRPPIAFDKLEKNRIMEFEGSGSLRKFVLNPSTQTVQRLMGPKPRGVGPNELMGGVRGIVRPDGNVVLFPIDLFHDAAMRTLGLIRPGEERPIRFIMERTRKGMEFFFELPNEGRRLLRTNPNVRRLVPPDQLPDMLRGKPASPSTRPFKGSRPTSPATTPKEPIL